MAQDQTMHLASVVKIGRGKEWHLANPTSAFLARPFAFCKGLRMHRAFTVSLDLSTITCAKCRSRAVALGYVKA